MSTESIISLILGFILGNYSTVVKARYDRFIQLRDEALRIIRSIDFMQEQNRIVITNDQDIPRLTLIASDFLLIQQKSAAQTINEIRSDIDQMFVHARAGRLKTENFNKSFSNWQEMAREINPNKSVIFSPWGKL